jgi:hypothetical protein
MIAIFQVLFNIFSKAGSSINPCQNPSNKEAYLVIVAASNTPPFFKTLFASAMLFTDLLFPANDKAVRITEPNRIVHHHKEVVLHHPMK